MRTSFLAVTLTALVLAALTMVVPAAGPGSAWAAAAGAIGGGAKTFTVLPFQVNGPEKYAYLRQGVQSMLFTRLASPGKLVPGEVSDAKPAGSAAQAGEVLKRSGADWIVWGSMTVAGENVSLDLQAQSADGKSAQKPVQAKVGELIPRLESVARELQAEMLGAPTKAAAAAGAVAAAPGQPRTMNPELLPPDADKRGSRLNPDLIIEGSAEAHRWRSQSLPWAALGMVVGDLDGSGKKRIVIMSEKKLHVYDYAEEGLKPLGEYALPRRIEQPARLSLYDINRDGTTEIIVSGVADFAPLSHIVNFKDGKFSVWAETVLLHLNVVPLPPEYKPTLVGQDKGASRLFQRNEVHEVVLGPGGKLELGQMVNLPQHSNLFNFVYMPEGVDYKPVIIDSNDKMRVHTRDGQLLATTDESYAQSGVMLVWHNTKPGMGRPRESIVSEESYYVPMRMYATDLEKDGKTEIIVSRSISVAAQFFERYRSFPQGEIHALVWDGVGMALQWKTRPIKGTIIDYGLTDINADGKTDLYVLVNSHAGALGLDQRRAMMLVYALDADTVQAGGPAPRSGVGATTPLRKDAAKPPVEEDKRPIGRGSKRQ